MPSPYGTHERAKHDGIEPCGRTRERVGSSRYPPPRRRGHEPELRRLDGEAEAAVEPVRAPRRARRAATVGARARPDPTCTEVSSSRPPLESKRERAAAGLGGRAGHDDLAGRAPRQAARRDLVDDGADATIGTPSSTSSRPTPIPNRAGTPATARISLVSIAARPALRTSSSCATSAPNNATDPYPRAARRRLHGA